MLKEFLTLFLLFTGFFFKCTNHEKVYGTGYSEEIMSEFERPHGTVTNNIFLLQ